MLLVRHGESAVANLARPFPSKNGHGDPPLHPVGRAQADRVGACLEKEPIHAIYVSSLCRTVETATPLAQALGLKPLEVPELCEIHLGDWELGLYRQKGQERDPIYIDAMRQERWDIIPNAESNESFAMRIKNGLDHIHAENADKLVAVFVHGGVIAQVVAMATGSSNFAFLGADNGSITKIVMTGDHIRVRSYNETSHLSGLKLD